HLMRYWQAGSGNLVFFASASLKPFQRLSRRARVILDLMPQIIQSIKINKAMEIIETDGKQIPVMTETVDPIAGKQKPFSAVENNWLQTNLNKAGVLGIKYSSGGELTPKELDIIFSRWMSSSESKESNEDIANALGAAFGQYFVEKHGFKWMVHFWNGEPESMVLRDNVMTYPLSVVWKRIDSGDINFFDDISSVILQRQEENRNN
ncbi:MAG: DUF3806 domain-containing protein, partial [Planctomycetes bacterium]|nr:DUF3806 domain-containing protein [Planctomycetota bacterium]